MIIVATESEFNSFINNSLSIIKESGGRLNAETLVSLINEKFGVKYSRTNVYRLLHALNFSWITSRSRHPKQSQEIQEDFKKTQNEIDRKDP